MIEAKRQEQLDIENDKQDRLAKRNQNETLLEELFIQIQQDEIQMDLINKKDT